MRQKSVRTDHVQ